MSTIWRDLRGFLEKHGKAALFLVAESRGSAPGKLGFKMALTPEGEQSGTIGGGIMEHKLAESAKQALARDEHGIDLVEQIHRDNAPEEARSGMICAGSQKIITCLLNSDNAELLQTLASAEEQNQATGLTISPNGITTAEPSDREPGLTQTEAGGWTYHETACRP
ncbi:MAG: XdhC family protein, partial [Acidobacteriota bacterium]|nr:XdhC family protein [Acidobacteriota bacterium]